MLAQHRATLSCNVTLCVCVDDVLEVLCLTWR